MKFTPRVYHKIKLSPAFYHKKILVLLSLGLLSLFLLETRDFPLLFLELTDLFVLLQQNLFELLDFQIFHFQLLIFGLCPHFHGFFPAFLPAGGAFSHL